jgi:hypothetical protein
VNESLTEIAIAAPVPVFAAPAVLAVPLDALEEFFVAEPEGVETGAALLEEVPAEEAGGEGVGMGAEEAPLI